MRVFYRGIFFLTIFFSLVGCGGGDLSKPVAQKVNGGEIIANFPANLLRKKLLEDKLIKPTDMVFGFKAYKIPYSTTDEKGNVVKASGVMVVPTDLDVDKNTAAALKQMKQVGLAMVLDAHGTVFANSEAPSQEIATTLSPAGSATIYTSLSGFVTLQPDYIGYGDSTKHPHPYLLKKSSANCMVDFAKAAIKFAKDNKIPIVATKDLYLSGYSQGGYVAMAALKKLESESFNVKMATPMAGPYFLEAIAQNVLAQDTIGEPSFMAAVALSYSQTYNIPIDSLIQEPYASKLDKLFDRSKTRAEIDTELTTKVKGDGGLFTNEIAQNLQTSLFFAKLHENGVIDFTPTTPIRFIKCKGDEVIPYSVSQAAESVLKNQLNAQDVALIPVEITLTQNPNTQLRYKHAECGKYAYAISAKMFSGMREATIGY